MAQITMVRMVVGDGVWRDLCQETQEGISPIRKAALKARITPRILSLSKPKITPQFPPHCYHPEHIYDVLTVQPPPRKKFTPQGWRLHQIRLLYLSKPVSRPEYEYFYM